MPFPTIAIAAKPLTGAACLLEGMRLIARPGLRRFVAVPLAVNVLLFSAAIVAGMRLFEQSIASLETRLPGWLGWLDWLLWPLFVLVLLVVVFNGFASVANLIASPFNSLLAEKVERLLTGRPLDQGTTLGGALRELLPTVFEELKKLLYGLVLALPFLLMLLIPLVGQVLWFLFMAWILALQYVDYPMGNHGLRFRDMRRRLGQERALSLGFGASAALLSMVPLVNFLLMPSAVAGATALWVRELKGGNGYPGPTQSRVATRCVLLTIDHLSGRISGELRSEGHRGQPLDQVATEDLIDLLSHCYARDPESAEALEVYLERERGRAAPERGRSQRANPSDEASRPMHPDEARAVLGLDPTAGEAEIRQAHRRLIQRLHPDRGGSDYLAAKINEAKRILLG